MRTYSLYPDPPQGRVMPFYMDGFEWMARLACWTLARLTGRRYAYAVIETDPIF